MVFVYNAAPKSLRTINITGYTPVISAADISRGYITRYFTRQVNSVNGEITEISQATYNTLQTNNLYMTIQVMWHIAGQLDVIPGSPLSSIVTTNTNAMQLANTQMPGMNAKIPSPMQYYQASTAFSTVSPTPNYYAPVIQTAVTNSISGIGTPAILLTPENNPNTIPVPPDTTAHPIGTNIMTFINSVVVHGISKILVSSGLSVSTALGTALANAANNSNVGFSVVGVHLTSVIGLVVVNVNNIVNSLVSVNGVSLTENIGVITVSGKSKNTLTGNQVSSVLGTYSVMSNAKMITTGIQETVVLGTDTVHANANKSIIGVQASSALGNVLTKANTFNINVIGNQILSALGTEKISANAKGVISNGTQISSSIGSKTLVANSKKILIGVNGTSILGTVSITAGTLTHQNVVVPIGTPFSNIYLVQQQFSSQGISSNTITASLASSHLGNLLVAAIACETGAIASVTDNIGNVYVHIANSTSTLSTAYTDFWYVSSSKSGATMVTVNFATSATLLSALAVWEVSGSAISPIDSATNTTGTSTTATAGSLTTTQTNAEFIPAICLSQFPVTGMVNGNPFTLGFSASPLGAGIETAYLITTSTGSYSPQWAQSDSGEYLGSMVAFDALKISAGVFGNQVLTAIGTATITRPSTTNFDPANATTGQGILNTNGAKPVWFDYPNRYTTDAAWRATVFNGIGTYSNAALKGTYSGGDAWTSATMSGCRYGDGRYPDLVTLIKTPDHSFGPNFNEACWEGIVTANNLASSEVTCEMRPVFDTASQIESFVIVRRMAYCSTPKFTAVGDGNASFNAGAGASWKSGPFASYLGSGRAGQETGNWGGGSSPSGELFLLTETPAGGGFSEVGYGVDTDSSWYDGTPMWEQIIVEQWTRTSDSTYWTAATKYVKFDGDTQWTKQSPRIVSTITSITKFYEFDINSVENYNHSRATELKYWFMQAAMFDFDNPNNDGSNDPTNALAYYAGVTPATPASISVTSKSSTGITVKVPMSMNMGRIRLKIDGAFISGQDYVVQREDAEQLEVSGATTIDYKTFSVTGLSLASGTHTVVAYAVNKNNTALDPTGVSTTFTI